MIRGCSKFLIPLPSRNSSPVCLGRFYVASTDHTQRRHASGEETHRPPRRFRTIFYSTVGATLLGVGGIVVYAKNDPKFRKVVESYIPGSDKFISIIYQEGDTWKIDPSLEQLKSLSEKALSFPVEIYKQITGDEVKSIPTPSAKELKSNDSVKITPKPAVGTGEKKPLVAVPIASEETESFVKAAENDALKLYNKAISLLEARGSEVIDLIDKAVESNDQKLWSEIQKKVEENKKVLEEVERIEKEAGDKIKPFSGWASKHVSKDFEETLKVVEDAKAKLQELKRSRIGAANKYFDKVEEARKHFSEELSTLFPGVKLGDTQIKLKDSEVDLFLYYASQKLHYYQKELAKLETLTSNRLKKSIQDSKDSVAIQSAIDVEVEKAKRKIKEDYDTKMLGVKDECEKDLQKQLKRQEQVHLDLLNDQLKLKEQEVERKLIQQIDTKVLEEEARLQVDLADMTGRMQGLNEAIAKRALQDQKAQTSQALWSAAEALYESLKSSSSDKKLQPLTPKVEAIKNAAAKGDDLVDTVVATIPQVALKRGVYSEDVLRERFLKLEGVAWRVAGVPDGGASLPVVFLSWLQGAFIIKASEPIPSAELNNEPINPDELNNYEILQRARYWVDRSDYEQALKYMNLLNGGARSISLDWIKEVTLNLETKQAANLLLAHAAASGMVYS